MIPGLMKSAQFNPNLGSRLMFQSRMRAGAGGGPVPTLGMCVDNYS